MGYFQSKHVWASHSRLLAFATDRSVEGSLTKEFWRGTKVIYCWFYFLLFAYCFVFVLCLFIDLFKNARREDIALRVRPSLSLCFPTLLPSDHSKKSGILALLSKEGLALIYPSGENILDDHMSCSGWEHRVWRVRRLFQLCALGLATHLPCALVVWSLKWG